MQIESSMQKQILIKYQKCIVLLLAKKKKAKLKQTAVTAKKKPGQGKPNSANTQGNATSSSHSGP